jgi:hypothetical protein
MITSKFTLNVTLLCLTLLLGGLTVVYAQETDEGESSAVVAPSGQLSLTFEQLGYDTKQLNRKRPQRAFVLNIPGNFQISPTGNYFDLVTHHLPDTPNKPSVLKVISNGRPLYTFVLTSSNALSNTVRIPLPQGLLQVGYNYIRLELDTSDTCEDPGALLDVFIDSSSTVSFGYQQNPYPIDLSFYPFPFVEESLLNIPVALILPDHPTSNDLTAAATIAAGLGQKSKGTINLTTTLASELGLAIRDNHHLIVIGQPGDNTLLDDLELPIPIDSTSLGPEQGILEEISSPWNEYRLLLAVSGLDDAGVLKASQALNRKAHFLGMRGPTAIVTQVDAVYESSAPRLPSMTLADLGYEDKIVYGAEPQDHSFYFALPLGWRLEEPPFFVLKFAHAEILDPLESAIDITLNDVPIGSTLLDESNATTGELTLSLPKRVLKAGRNHLRIGVEMNFNDASRDKCKDLLDQRAWTVISNESEIILPYDAVDLPPNLGYFPHPFSQSSGLGQTLFVLPDQPSSSTLDDLIQLVALLGSASQTQYTSVHIAYASEADQSDWQDYHLILLGRPTENALLSRLNAYLPQPFVPDSDILEPLAVDSVAFLPDPERDAGLLEISPSPWSQDHSLLAITGTTDEGVRLAVQALAQQTKYLTGNLAVIEPVLTYLSQSSQISTYSIDTRPPSVTSNGSNDTTENDTATKSDLVLLAERWWK